MIDFAYTLLAFLVAISILVAVHEFGHFWVAKRLGVKVLRYSIGFGRPLWKRRYGPDQTEYVIAALPLGGYVKMLDEREGEVPPAEQERAFNRQPVAKRIAIVAAGPVFNFLFAGLAYWMMLSIGVTGFKPVIGNIAPDSVMAQAGFEPNEEIISVNGQATPIWDVALQELSISALNRDTAEIVVKKTGYSPVTREIDFKALDKFDEPGEALQAIGLKPWQPKIEAQVGNVLEKSPAAQAGLQSGDTITAINGVAIHDWFDLVDFVSARPGKPLKLTILRHGKSLTLNMTPKPVERDGKTVGQIGISPAAAPEVPDEMKNEYQYPLFAGFRQAGEKVWRNSVLTLKMIAKLVTGQVSLKNLSGPINIARYAGYSASAGIAKFLDFLAIVSISLGVINLLPIPLLDGGHLLYYVIEIIKGRPVSEYTEMLGQRIGIMIIIMMMALAIGNDLSRLFGG